jgi:CRISPR-associated protein Csx14
MKHGGTAVKNKRRAMRGGVLIATLGVEPQVVTIALDCLLVNGEDIQEVVVIYTESSRVREALQVIEREFANAVYPGIKLNTVAVTSNQGPIDDFCTENDLQSLLRTVYAEVRRARQAGGAVHFCISGGRKVMGIIGMVVAQLLFGPDDSVWYLITEGWSPGSERNLHISSSVKNWLVPIPVLRWNDAGTLMQTVAEINDPAEIMNWYNKLSNLSKEKRRDEFLNHWLTPVEKDIVRMVCLGLDNVSIAAAQCKQVQTVANHLRNVYAKMRDWVECPGTNVTRSRLIAEFAPHFRQSENK